MQAFSLISMAQGQSAHLVNNNTSIKKRLAIELGSTQTLQLLCLVAGHALRNKVPISSSTFGSSENERLKSMWRLISERLYRKRLPWGLIPEAVWRDNGTIRLS
jgi:hypothetical protein